VKLLALLAAATAAALWWARRHLVRVVVVGQSMQPTLDPGDVVLVRRTAGRGLRPRRLVVAQTPSAPYRWHEPGGSPLQTASRTWMVKRIAALRLDGGSGQGDPDLRSTLAPGTVYLVGDNPTASYDSRAVGPWPVDRLLGIVVCRLRRAAAAAGPHAVSARTAHACSSMRATTVPTA
jgi:signal peptidase I